MATKTELERISVIETKVDGLRSEVSEIKNNVHDIGVELVKKVKDLDAKIDGLDSRFAARWVQTAVAFVIGIVMTAVIGALVALVLIKPGDSTVTTSTTEDTTTTTVSPNKVP